MKQNIALAASLIKSGHVVAFPTETVYGLGASVFQEKGLEAIFLLKKRAKDNPLIVHINNLEQVALLARDIPKDFYLLAEMFFPGPLTLILPKKESISPLVSASLDTIAIRMPRHEIAQLLLKEVGEPIAAPSANLSGKPSPTSYNHVAKDFSQNIPMILDGGECEIGIESTVLSLVGQPTLLRPGSITQEELEAILGKKILVGSKSDTPLCPGMKYRHYAPNAKVILFRSKEDLKSSLLEKNAMILSNSSIEGVGQVYSYSSQNLYKLFHLADEKDVENLLILLDEDTLKNKGLINRIEKANSQS